jgi:inner membrane protein
MMSVTHIAFSVALTSITLGTANPEILGIAAVAALLPDIDTGKSSLGRLLFPVSSWLEKRTVHRGITHSFFASGVVTLAAYPLALLGYSPLWYGLILGYFFGWFADVFTKSGVQAFYPGRGRMIIPRNPRLRLATRSNAEWFLLFVLVVVSVLSISINSGGGLIRGFNQALGLPSGAIETVNEDASRYLLRVRVQGRNAITEQPIDATYEVIEPLTVSDLLVKDEQGTVYRLGSSQESQIIASRLRVERVAPVQVKIENILLEDEYLDRLANLTEPFGLAQGNRVYLTGTLTIADGSGLSLPSHADRFDTITLQPGNIAYARLTAASPQYAIDKLGEYSVSGHLIARIVNVQ